MDDKPESRRQSPHPLREHLMKTYGLALFACLVIGLAPFYPEPHLLKQLNNFQAGRLNQLLDIFDVFMHGAPFLYLLYLMINDLLPRLRR